VGIEECIVDQITLETILVEEVRENDS